MTRQLAGLAARATGVVRGLWPDRNPLRRRADRVEVVIVGGLVAAFLAGVPLAAVATGSAVYSAVSRTARSEQASWHQVPAVLLSTGFASSFGYGQMTAQARWTAPDGEPRTGVIPVPLSAVADRTVLVWVDEAGRPTGPPLRPTQVRNQAEMAAMFAAICLGIVLLWAGQVAHTLLDRRRLAAWDADWRSTEPQWTARR